MPEVGDEIGPFLLLRELGEGGFARVFLAEQSDLDHRLVVVKVSTRITPEPRLLARARHSHIVEVLWHSLIDDGSLPVGLHAVSGRGDARGRPGRPEAARRRPRSGRDLLAELDRVSAPEYPTADLARPSREIIARLSYPKAVAWIVARLAEALDYAYSRGVLHGDVKPSNILLTADGEPMLLDFNLAVGWRSPGGDDLPGDAGGTLAYMAPERLRAVAQPEACGRPRGRRSSPCRPVCAGHGTARGTGWSDSRSSRGARRARRGNWPTAFALSRQQGAETLIRSCRVSIAPALRSILTRCLAPDPADRYNRASELAEDLDRWCSDRPLAFAREPHWRFGVLRWARRRRLAVVAGAVSLVVAAVSTTGRLDRGPDLAPGEGPGQAGPPLGRHRVERVPIRTVRPMAARRARCSRRRCCIIWLTTTSSVPVIGASSDEFRALPESERLELEIWLLEQSLRLGLCTAAASRILPTTGGAAWRCWSGFVAVRPLGPLETECSAPASPTRTPRALDPERPGFQSRSIPALDGGVLARGRGRAVAGTRTPWSTMRMCCASVPSHSGGIIARPLSPIASAIRQTAADHLEQCIARRPENPALRGQLAGCLYDLHRFDAALEQCNKALTLNPDHAESYRTRAFIRNGSAKARVSRPTSTGSNC